MHADPNTMNQEPTPPASDEKPCSAPFWRLADSPVTIRIPLFETLPTMKLPLKKGDLVTVKNNTYGKFQFRAHMPKGHAGINVKTCEVLHSSDGNFDIGIVKTFRLSDVKLSQTNVKSPLVHPL